MHLKGSQGECFHRASCFDTLGTVKPAFLPSISVDISVMKTILFITFSPQKIFARFNNTPQNVANAQSSSSMLLRPQLS